MLAVSSVHPFGTWPVKQLRRPSQQPYVFTGEPALETSLTPPTLGRWRGSKKTFFSTKAGAEDVRGTRFKPHYADISTSYYKRIEDGAHLVSESETSTPLVREAPRRNRPMTTRIMRSNIVNHV